MQGAEGSALALLLLLSIGKKRRGKLNCQKWNCSVISIPSASLLLQHQRVSNSASSALEISEEGEQWMHDGLCVMPEESQTGRAVKDSQD